MTSADQQLDLDIIVHQAIVKRLHEKMMAVAQSGHNHLPGRLVLGVLVQVIIITGDIEEYELEFDQYYLSVSPPPVTYLTYNNGDQKAHMSNDTHYLFTSL